ncbi:LysM peptidoglycan-binding domain-containing protein [Staphylococcus hyicus]|uniref:LysM peptidoglycan-binding domain-containing protein n=1 Tax=Staphylococcus hyicus TaxID=1284 RepID=A0ACD5FKK7_STAHY
MICWRISNAYRLNYNTITAINNVTDTQYIIAKEKRHTKLHSRYSC